MKIHFASFFGVDYDMDLLPYWSRFYLDAKLDSYTIFLHRFPESVTEAHVQTFHDLGFHVKLAPCSEYRDGLLQNNVLGAYANSLPPGDILVVADADEFHLRNDPQTNSGILPYKELFEKYDIITGLLQDRYADALADCNRDPFEQYPYSEELPGIVRSFRPPYLNDLDWPETLRTKILASRVDLRVNFSGSHGVPELPVTTRILDGMTVAHFAWRSGALKKIEAKSYFSNKVRGQVKCL